MMEGDGSSSAANTNLKFLQTLAGLYNAFDGITPLAYAAPPSGPSITKLQPSECEPGELIIITGKRFGDTQGASVVHIGSDTFGSSSPGIELWSDKEIRIRVPDYMCEWFEGQDFKDQDVWVTVGGVDSNMKTLKVLKPASCTSTGGSGTYYFINNHLGYPQKLVDDNLTVVWSSISQVFGLAVVDEDPDGNGQTVVNNIRFPGQYFDNETGLHYNYHRYYDPSTGRYLTPDPSHQLHNKGENIPYLLYSLIDKPQELHRYVYTNNPITLCDPLGLTVTKNCERDCDIRYTACVLGVSAGAALCVAVCSLLPLAANVVCVASCVYGEIQGIFKCVSMRNTCLLACIWICDE